MLTQVNCLDRGHKIKYYPNAQKVTAYTKGMNCSISR